MSAMLNDRDAILQAAATRIVNPKNADILLQQSAPGFHVNAAGAADVASITVSATVVGLEGAVSWSVQGATLSNVTDREATVTYAAMQASTAIVSASIMSSGERFAKSVVLATIQDGAPGSSAKTVKLTPSEQVFKINKAGAGSPASITLTATGQNTAGTPSFTIPVGTATLTAGSSSAQKVLTLANMTTDQVTIEVTLDGQKDRVTIYKVREGQDGQPGVDAVVGLLTNETVTLPAGSNGVVSSFSGAVCTMKVYQGAADDSANWAYAFAPASASNRLSYTTTGGTLTITGMAAGVDSAYVDITATKTGAAAVTKRFTVTKSKAGASVTGARGAGTYYVVGSAWSDVAAQAACPGGPVVNDQVTISNGTVTYTKRWDGAAWNVPGAYLSGSLFVEGDINGSKLKAGTVQITTPDGTPVVTIGGLQPGFEAPDTKNSEQQWGDVKGAGKPADNATVGADASNLNIALARRNLLPSSSLPSSLGDCTKSDGGGIVGVTGPFYAGPDHQFGVYSPKGQGAVWVQVSGTPTSGQFTDLYHEPTSKAIPIVGGRRYEIGVSLSAHRCRGRLIARQYDAAGTFLEYAFGTSYVEPAIASNSTHPNDFPRATAVFTAHANAVKITLSARLQDASGANPYLFASHWYLAEALPAQTAPSPWSPSPEEAMGVLLDYNAGNNRNGTAVTAPTVATDGTAVDHTIRTDGAADISFEWAWAGNEGDIDGFLVYVFQRAAATAYTFGTTPAEETVFTVPANQRSFILYGAGANLYTTFGVQAYRVVDKAVNAASVIKSSIVKSTRAEENPYRPSSSVAFAGNVTGTINGTLAETVASNAAAGKSASDAIPGINTSLAGKLAAAGNQNLTGPVTLTSSGAIVVGTVNDGVRISTGGLLGRKGGYTTFSIAADGTALFGGNLVAATGTLGSLRIADGGYICYGGYNGWNGPAAGTGGGFTIHPLGAVWGNYADGRFVAIYENGDILAPGFSLANKQLTLDRPIIVSPRVSQPIYDTFAYNALGGGFVSGPNGNLSNSVTLQITGNNGPHKIAWSYVRLSGGTPSAPSWADGSGDTFGVGATASNTTLSFKVSAVITGTDGRTLNYSDIFTLQFGTV